MWLYQYPNNGALVITACSTTGQLYSWLDANSAVDPITTQLSASGAAVSSMSVSAFGAAPIRGPDAPGFVAAVSFSDGAIAMVSAARSRVSHATIRNPSQCAMAPRGIFKALSEVYTPEEDSWMHALGGGEDQWWVQRAIGTFMGTTKRERAASAGCNHVWVQHNVRSPTATLAALHLPSGFRTDNCSVQPHHRILRAVRYDESDRQSVARLAACAVGSSTSHVLVYPVCGQQSAVWCRGVLHG